MTFKQSTDAREYGEVEETLNEINENTAHNSTCLS